MYDLHMNPTRPPHTMASMLREPIVSAALAGYATFAVLVLRRGTSLTKPEVWDEDGLTLIPEFLTQGWTSLLHSYQGYYNTAPRILTGLTVTFAPQDYPVASTVLAWLVTAAVMAFVAWAPVRLRGGLLLAFVCLLLPTKPECLGTPLYASWWTTIPLLLLPFWEAGPRHLALRAIVLALGGLSSPVAIVTTPLMVLRALRDRTRADAVLATISAACALLQAYVVVTVRGAAPGFTPTLGTPRTVLEKFFGWFIWDTSWVTQYEGIPTLLVAGFIVLAACLYAAWQMRDAWLGMGMLYLIGGTIAASAARIGVDVIDPLVAGPRYFFYPFILIAWLLVSLMVSAPRRAGRAVAAGLLSVSLVNAVSTGWSHDHAEIHWTRHVASCVHFARYTMPIVLDGQAGNYWRQTYTRDQCRRLGGTEATFEPGALYPFSALDASPAAEKAGLSKDMRQPSVSLTIDRGAQIAFLTSDRASGLHYRVESGARIFTGELPLCHHVCVLEFASDLLAETAQVTFLDEGNGPDDWFAAAEFKED